MMITGGLRPFVMIFETEASAQEETGADFLTSEGTIVGEVSPHAIVTEVATASATRVANGARTLKSQMEPVRT